jgi:peptide/nickel transport system permease protein
MIKSSKIVIFILWIYIFIGVFADFLANDKPIYCNIHGRNYFPIIKEIGVKLKITSWDDKFLSTNWESINYDYVLMPPINYSPLNMSLSEVLVPPLSTSTQTDNWRKYHLLGTGSLGEDVASCLIHGTRLAIIIGLTSVMMAFIIGLFTGILVGYYGDYGIRLSKKSFVWILFILFFGYFYAFKVFPNLLLPDYLFVILEVVLVLIIIFLLSRIKINQLHSKILLPLDSLISRMAEIYDAIPKLLILFTLVSILRPSLWTVILIIGGTSWPSFAFYIRSRIIAIKSLPYIEAGSALGLSQKRIIIKHIIPNALSVILPLLAFSASGAILAEASLSFLGLGLPPEYITYGKLLSIAKESTQAWWLLFFPGMMLLVLIIALNRVGQKR